MSKILDLITIIPFWGYRKINGWLTTQEAIGLNKVAKLMPENATVVEIGSWQGKSTFCILSGLKSGKVYAIDPFDASAGDEDPSEDEYQKRAKGIDLLDIFKNNVSQFLDAGKVKILKGFSNQYHNDFEKIDFLFIDGDHSIKGCKEDYDLYANKVAKGGYIAFHDYYPNRPELGPTHVIKEIISKEQHFSFYGKFDSLWVGKKN